MPQSSSGPRRSERRARRQRAASQSSVATVCGSFHVHWMVRYERLTSSKKRCSAALCTDGREVLPQAADLGVGELDGVGVLGDAERRRLEEAEAHLGEVLPGRERLVEEDRGRADLPPQDEELVMALSRAKAGTTATSGATISWCTKSDAPLRLPGLAGARTDDDPLARAHEQELCVEGHRRPPIRERSVTEERSSQKRQSPGNRPPGLLTPTKDRQTADWSSRPSW